ncbi:MAG: hypothetical protein ACOYKE_14650, partial [Ferruginibacter sp.]
MLHLTNKFTANLTNGSWYNQWTYNFEQGTGNMLDRRNQIGITGNVGAISPRNLFEEFTYDVFDRLHTIDKQGETLTYDFTDAGSIDQITTTPGGDVQDYVYDQNMPVHAIKQLLPAPPSISPKQQIDYTPFNKIATIREGDKYLLSDYTQ